MFHILQNPLIRLPNARGKRGQPVEKKFYTVLGVSPDATQKQIKRAFRKESIKHHPDKGGKDEYYVYLQKVYEVLSDEEKRHCYDAFGESYESIPGIDQWKRHVKSKDVGIHLDLSLKECLVGKHCELTYTRNVKGTFETRIHEVYVPPGTPNRHTFLYGGLGHQEKNKLLPGNLLVVVNEKKEAHFRRYGNVLLHEVQVHIAAALTGSPIEIQHPKGHVFDIKNNESFHPEKWYEIKHEGGTRDHSMFVKFSFTFPHLTVSQKQKVLEVFGYLPTKEKPDTKPVKAMSERELKRLLSTSKEHDDRSEDCCLQ